MPPKGKNADLISDKPAEGFARVSAGPNTRLEQLLALYAELGPQVDAVTKRYDDVKAALKAELHAAGFKDGITRISGDAPALGLAVEVSWVETWRFDAKRCKVEDPAAYVRFAKKDGAWVLRKVAL